MILHHPDRLTTLPVWAPRYSSLYKDGERVALLAQYKVQQASPVIIVEFTKAKHLIGQRFAITREKVMGFPLGSNTKIPCYEVPMSAFDSWESAVEVRDFAFSLFPETS